MTTEQYNSMVAMLITATQNKKLIWKSSDEDFCTNIGGCSIWLCSNYDFSVNVSTYNLKLFNKDNVQFENFSYSDDVNADEYRQLDQLYKSIRDVLYKITESENIILKGLNDLMTPDFSETDDLPF